MSVLEAKNISYNYANSKEKVLSSINQGFEEGVFYAIIGKSGAGKSTFLSLHRKAGRYFSGEKISRKRDTAITERITYRSYSKTII